MKGVLAILISMLLFGVGLLVTLLFGHVISLVFGYGWALSGDNKGACAVIGSFIGVFLIIAYWCTDYDDF